MMKNQTFVMSKFHCEKKYYCKFNFQPGVMKKNERIFKKRNGNNLQNKT